MMMGKWKEWGYKVREKKRKSVSRETRSKKKRFSLAHAGTIIYILLFYL